MDYGEMVANEFLLRGFGREATFY